MVVFQCTQQCTQRLKAMRRAGAAIKPLFDERRAGKRAVRLASGSEIVRGAGRAASGNAGSRGPLQPIEHLAIYPKMSSG